MQIQIPYNFSPRDYQREFLLAPQRFKIAVIHRRGGKSKTSLNQQIMRTQMKHSPVHGWLPPNDSRLTKEDHLKNKYNVFYYFLPTYKQAKTTIWDALIKQHVPMQLVSKINQSELAIYWKNGAIQRFAGTDDFNKHRGINPIDVVFDEYSEQDERIWLEIIQPVFRENHGTGTWIFTPKGRNHSWSLLEAAKTNKEWFWMVRGIDDTHALTEAEVEEAKIQTPQAFFEQEYHCSFLDNAGAFFRRVKENVYYGTEPVNPSHYYHLGVDLAKYNDWTVLTPFDLNTFRVLTPDRFNQIDWNLQKARIEASALRHNDAKVKIDRSGVGDPIVEDLTARGLNIDEEEDSVVFTEKSKKLLLTHLAVLLEQDKIKIPNHPILIAELESLQYKFNKNNKLKFEMPKNMTDDMVMSLALAVKDVSEPINELRIARSLTNSSSENLYDGI